MSILLSLSFIFLNFKFSLRHLCKYLQFFLKSAFKFVLIFTHISSIIICVHISCNIYTTLSTICTFASYFPCQNSFLHTNIHFFFGALFNKVHIHWLEKCKFHRNFVFWFRKYKFGIKMQTWAKCLTHHFLHQHQLHMWMNPFKNNNFLFCSHGLEGRE